MLLLTLSLVPSGQAVAAQAQQQRVKFNLNNGQHAEMVGSQLFRIGKQGKKVRLRSGTYVADDGLKIIVVNSRVVKILNKSGKLVSKAHFIRLHKNVSKSTKAENKSARPMLERKRSTK